MDTLIHADIFFFVTTIAVGLVTIGVVIVLIFAIVILNNVRNLSETVRTQADHLVEDIDRLRARSQSISWSIAFRIFRNFFKKRNQ